MNRVLLQNFNSVIHKNDTVYILGDICHHMKIEDADELSYGSLWHYNAGGWYDHEFSHL
jgi:calcineurin-like phosphoesterase family protein